jgi:hypothetical protein
MIATMAKKKKPDRSEDRHRLPLMSFRPTADVRTVIEAQARRERRSAASMLQILVEEALQARALWQPTQEGGTS